MVQFQLLASFKPNNQCDFRHNIKEGKGKERRKRGEEKEEIGCEANA